MEGSRFGLREFPRLGVVANCGSMATPVPAVAVLVGVAVEGEVGFIVVVAETVEVGTVVKADTPKKLHTQAVAASPLHAHYYTIEGMPFQALFGGRPAGFPRLRHRRILTDTELPYTRPRSPAWSRSGRPPARHVRPTVITLAHLSITQRHRKRLHRHALIPAEERLVGLRGMEIDKAPVTIRIAELNTRAVDFNEQCPIAPIRVRDGFRNHALGTRASQRLINMSLGHAHGHAGGRLITH